MSLQNKFFTAIIAGSLKPGIIINYNLNIAKITKTPTIIIEHHTFLKTPPFQQHFHQPQKRPDLDLNYVPLTVH